MGAILWEDSIQRDLKHHNLYTGVTAETLVEPHEPVINTRADGEAHTAYATRRSRYFTHTKKGKKYTARAVVRVKAQYGRRVEL